MSKYLLETIKISDGKALNLSYHQKRMDISRKILGYENTLKIKLSPPPKGEYRCRIIYSKNIEKVEYIPYKKRTIKSFKLLHSNIDYSLKYENRDEINALFSQKKEADEIIIIKDSLITDTSIANICFWNKGRWITPKTPLLRGTARERLLGKNKIECADIFYKDIHNFSKIAIINAMVEFYVIENAIIL